MKAKTIPQEALIPLKRLNFYKRKYPGFISSCDDFLRQQRKNPKIWPRLCFAPLGKMFNKLGEYCVKHKVKNLQQELIEIYGNIDEITAVTAWSKTQDIFVFDKDLLSAVIDSEFCGDLPIDVLTRFCAWSFYVKFPPDFKVANFDNVDGFFSFFEFDEERQELELRLIVELKDETHVPLVLHLGEYDLREAIKRTYLFNREHLPKDIAKQYDEFVALFDPKLVEKNIAAFLNVLLYLCSKEPDLDSTQSQALANSFPHFTTTRQGATFIEPKNVSLINVGKNQGEQLRQAKARTEKQLSISTGHGTGKRSHVRRAHWHRYWTGAKHSDVRKIEFRWISFLMINSLGKLQN